MTTPSEVYAALKSLIEANKPSAVTAMRWQDMDADSTGLVPLPDVPATFIYTEFLTEKSDPIEIGGGRGANRHRCPAHVDIYVFVPRGTGLRKGDGSGSLEIADALAGILRPYAQNGITVDSATSYPGGDGSLLMPKGLSSEVGNYFWSAVGADLHFDLIG